MPVDKPCADYTNATDQWQCIRDVLAGADAVKASPFKYLRRPSGLKWDEAGEYAKSAVFFNATSRTLDGLVGAIFRKPPEITVPERWRYLETDVTGAGEPLDVFAKRNTREVIGMGRAGVVVDMASSGGRPYLRMYAAEDIINWRMAVIDGVPTLTLVVLRESGERIDPLDRFKAEPVERYLVLELVRPGDADAQPAYSASTFERRAPGRFGGDDIVQVSGPYFPQRRGDPLPFIPFQFFAPDNLRPGISQSPLLPLVEVNLSHFNSSASVEHGAWWTALPCYVISGNLSGAGHGELHVGASTAWQLEQGGQANILEYTGQGLNALEARLERKEAHMAVLGARLLEDQKAGVEAAETVGLRHRGENSVLTSIAETVSRGLSNCLRMAAWWDGMTATPAETEAAISLNTDFLAAAMNAGELTALVAAWQSGAIGNQTLHHNLRQGERLPDGMSLDGFEEDQQAHGSGFAFLGTGNGFDHNHEIATE